MDRSARARWTNYGTRCGKRTGGASHRSGAAETSRLGAVNILDLGRHVASRDEFEALAEAPRMGLAMTLEESRLRSRWLVEGAKIPRDASGDIGRATGLGRACGAQEPEEQSASSPEVLMKSLEVPQLRYMLSMPLTTCTLVEVSKAHLDQDVGSLLGSLRV